MCIRRYTWTRPAQSYMHTEMGCVECNIMQILKCAFCMYVCGGMGKGEACVCKEFTQFLL